MGKKRSASVKAARLALKAAPTLLTDVYGADWSSGVLFVSADSGAQPVCLALGPNVGLQLLQFLQAGLLRDAASPLVLSRVSTPQPAEKELKP